MVERRVCIKLNHHEPITLQQTNIGQFVILRHVLKYLFIRLKCASRIVRNLSNRTGQKSAKFAKGRKSGKYI